MRLVSVGEGIIYFVRDGVIGVIGVSRAGLYYIVSISWPSSPAFVIQASFSAQSAMANRPTVLVFLNSNVGWTYVTHAHVMIITCSLIKQTKP